MNHVGMEDGCPEMDNPNYDNHDHTPSPSANPSPSPSSPTWGIHNWCHNWCHNWVHTQRVRVVLDTPLSFIITLSDKSTVA